MILAISLLYIDSKILKLQFSFYFQKSLIRIIVQIIVIILCSWLIFLLCCHKSYLRFNHYFLFLFMALLRNIPLSAYINCLSMYRFLSILIFRRRFSFYMFAFRFTSNFWYWRYCFFRIHRLDRIL